MFSSAAKNRTMPSPHTHPTPRIPRCHHPQLPTAEKKNQSWQLDLPLWKGGGPLLWDLISSQLEKNVYHTQTGRSSQWPQVAGQTMKEVTFTVCSAERSQVNLGMSGKHNTQLMRRHVL